MQCSCGTSTETEDSPRATTWVQLAHCINQVQCNREVDMKWQGQMNNIPYLKYIFYIYSNKEQYQNES